MTPYDTHTTADPFADSLSAFEALTTTLSGSDAGTWTHTDLEEHLDLAGRELLHLLLQDHLDLRAMREEEQIRSGSRQVVVGPKAGSGPGAKPGTRAGWPACSEWSGSTRVAHRGQGVSNVHPADAVLSRPAGRHATGLRRLAVTEAVRGSFDQAHDAVTRRCGNVLGKRRLEELVVAATVDVDSFYRTMIPVPCNRELPLVVQVDGKGVVMRPEALREATRWAAEKVVWPPRSARAGREVEPEADLRPWPASSTPIRHPGARMM